MLKLMFYCHSFFNYFQAIKTPSDHGCQQRAWDAVCPLVVRLKKYYEFSLSLGTLLNCRDRHVLRLNKSLLSVPVTKQY